MARYRIDQIANLARQLEFAPVHARAVEVDSAEALLHEIDPTRAYPYEFVVFRISGFAPQHTSTVPLLTGLALQHDLGLLVEHLSDTLDLRADDQPQPVLQIDDVCQKFSVTSKTIQRWRRKGLPARRFIFPDGKRRVGFRLESVERFFSINQNQVVRATNFSQVDTTEVDEIVRRARRLATMCHCCQSEITRRVARKLNRSPLTIQHVLQKHDEENPHDPVFVVMAKPIDESERTRILRGYRRGLAVRKLARRACRPKSAIWRVITSERLAKLNKRKVRFFDDPLYHQPDAVEVIDAIVRSAMAEVVATISTQPDTSGRTRVNERVLRDLPPYLAELYRTPLLTPTQERALFLKFNLHKFQFVTGRRKLEEEHARSRDLNLLETRWRRATEVKNQILCANLRLVVSVARKHVRPGVALMELVSEGNLTLMRAVEAFDVHKGNKFSTYATLALMKEFARVVPELLSSRNEASAESRLANLPDVRGATPVEHMVRRDEVASLLASLDEPERRVLIAHFGLDASDLTTHARTTGPTYDDVSRSLGLSKQRVRQLELTALAKLRKLISVG